MSTTNNYETYAKYYDEIVEKRRDFEQIARTLATLIGEKRKLLDIGVGTGSVVEKLLQINPQQYEIWGIDNSEPLLEQAKTKLEQENQVHLYLQDVLDFNLEQEFEIIYSRGGAFFFIGNVEEPFFASHLLSKNDNLKALKSIAKHLQNSGLFVLSMTDFKHDEEKELGNGVTYCRKTSRQTENGQEYLIIELSFQKNGEVVGQQILTLLLMDYDSSQEIFAEAGFQALNKSPGGEYHMYTKN